MKENLTKLFVLVLLVIGLVGCIAPEEEDKVPALSLVSDNYILYVGDEKEIEYYVDNLEEFELNYEISNNNVIKVENEKLIALSAGDATMKVSIKGYDDINQTATVKVIQNGSPAHIEMLDWVKREIGEELFEVKLFPTTHPTYATAKISYVSSDESVLSNRGLIFPKDYDEEISIKISVDYNGEIVSTNHVVNVVGNIPNNIAKDFLGQFYQVITNDVEINYFTTKYPDATITFKSGNEDILTSTGKYIKPDNDVNFNVYAKIEIPSVSYVREYSKNVTGRGMSAAEKALIVRDNVIEELNLSSHQISTATNLDLPFTEEKYNGVLTWVSSNPDVIGNDGKLTQPLLNTMVELRGTLQLDNGRSTFSIELEVLGRESKDKWSDIEEYLNFYIFEDEIQTLKYSVMGTQPSYIKNNDGYVLFYQNTDLEVTEDLLPADHPFRPGSPMTVKYITIHDTAGNGAGADAAMHSRFIHSTNRTASSWHYTIDDHSLYHHVPNNEVAWHAGDGSGQGNRASIGIETCTNSDGDYDVVILRTAKLVAKLLDDNGLSLYHVRQHFNWSGKNCPQVIRGSNRWGEVIDLIGRELYARQNLSDVKFEWKSLSPTILNDNGMVFAHPGPETEISYQVTVTYNDVVKTYTHTSTLQAKK